MIGLSVFIGLLLSLSKVAQSSVRLTELKTKLFHSNLYII